MADILVVEDEADIANLVRLHLEMLGHRVLCCDTLAYGRRALESREWALLVLDLSLPDGDGLGFCRALRDADAALPILMLTARSSEHDRVRGLETGADDYLAKPFSPSELMARIRAVLRRGDPVASDSVLEFGGWRMDRLAHELFAPDGGKVALTTREWRLLLALVEGQRRVLTRDDLMSRMEGEDFDSFDRAIDIAISRLRRKLAEHDPREVVRTVRGEGYALALPVAGR